MTEPSASIGLLIDQLNEASATLRNRWGRSRVIHIDNAVDLWETVYTLFLKEPASYRNGLRMRAHLVLGTAAAYNAVSCQPQHLGVWLKEAVEILGPAVKGHGYYVPEAGTPWERALYALAYANKAIMLYTLPRHVHGQRQQAKDAASKATGLFDKLKESEYSKWHAICLIIAGNAAQADGQREEATRCAKRALQLLNSQHQELRLVAEDLKMGTKSRVPGTGWFGSDIHPRTARIDPLRDLYHPDFS